MVFDVETTGLRRTDRIIEFACELVDAEGQVDTRYETLINPDRDPGPTRLHGVSAAMLADAPSFRDVAGDIQRLLRDRIPVAHGLRFDWSLLRGEFLRLGVDAPVLPQGICTARLAAAATGRTPSLARACRILGIPHDEPHVATSDVRATTQVLLAWRSHLSKLPSARACPPFRRAWMLPASASPVPRSSVVSLARAAQTEAATSEGARP